MKAVVLAGGKGTRLAPYTRILPKPLMPLGEEPILEIFIAQMRQYGITDVILTVGHMYKLIRTYFGDGEEFGVNIEYSLEEKPLGTSGPLALIEGLDDTFLVANGDVLSDLNLQDLVNYHHEMRAAATIAMYQREVKIDLGVMQMKDGTNEVVGYLEKPSYTYPVSMGIYVFEPRVLKYIPSNEYLDFPDLVLKLIASGEKVAGFPFNGYWRDLGRKQDYEEAMRDYAEWREKFYKAEE